jgi:hypothetical protein
MSVDGLMQTHEDPDVDSEDVQVLREIAVEQRPAYGAGAEDEDLKRVSELSSKAERRGIAVVQFVNIAIERAVMQGLMSCITQDGEMSSLDTNT